MFCCKDQEIHNVWVISNNFDESDAVEGKCPFICYYFFFTDQQSKSDNLQYFLCFYVYSGETIFNLNVNGLNNN